MASFTWKRCLVAAFAIMAIGIAGAGEMPGLAADSVAASLDYTVAPGAYNNSVFAAAVTSMLYPRLLVDDDSSSPFYGVIYVIGLEALGNSTCRAVTVVRSLDGGRTFGAPHSAGLCMEGLSLDVVVARNGTLYAAAWGPRILASTDSGQTWSLLATLGNASGPASLVVDPVTGMMYATWSTAGWHTAGLVSVSSSRDSGLTWTVPVSNLANGTLGTAPQIAAFGDSVVVALAASNASASFVAGLASFDGGGTWSNATALSRSAPCLRFSAPSLAVSPSGLFAVSWYEDPTLSGPGCWDTWGNGTETFVSFSLDGGRTFSSPRHVGGPPGWPTMSFGGALAFDDASRLYVTWHALQNWTAGSVYVANSTGLAQGFEEASFSTRLQVGGGNSTAQENLAAGSNGTVYLLWVAFDPSGDPNGPDAGIFVRTVAGEAEGTVALTTSSASAVLDIELKDSTTGAIPARTSWTGSTFLFGGLPPSMYDVWVRAGNSSVLAGRMPIRTWGRTTFTLHVQLGPGGPPVGGPAFPWELAGIAAAGIAAGGAALAVLHHSRIAREEILQRKIRALMYEHILNHPGASFSAVRDALGLQNGVAAYHLGVLEKLGFVHSESRRRHRWYYPNGDVSLWREMPLTPLQASIINQVQESPGIGVRELARALARRPSSVGYNVKALAREGILRTHRDGRRIRCFLSEGAGAT
ncbi:MAG: hypothetical protein WC985_00265 [Thermoplasmata archaeon]